MWLVTQLLATVTLLTVALGDDPCPSVPYDDIFEDQVIRAATRYFADISIGGDGFDVISADENWTPVQLFERVYDSETSTGAFVAALVDFAHANPVDSRLSSVGQFMALGLFQDARITFGGALKHNFASSNFTFDGMVCEDEVEGVEEMIEQRLNTLAQLQGNDLFGPFLNLKPGSALSFVMDTTGSMAGEIEAAKERVIDIIETTRGTPNAPLQLVLAPYNDPEVGPVTVTQDPDVFIDAVSGLFASGGGDFPELAMGGILLAAHNSGFRSIVYVFTDASAKDAELLNVASAVCLGKKISVYFFLTQTFAGMEVYQEMAKRTLGQVMVVSKSDVSSATEVLKATTTQGQVMLALVAEYTESEITAMVDKSVSNLIVLFTGTFSYLEYSGPVGDTSHFEGISEISGMKLFRLNGVSPGTYTFKFTGTPTLNANIMGTSTLGFHGILQQKIRGTDTYEASRQLQAGKDTIADIHIYGRTDGIRFTEFKLLSRNQQVLFSRSLDAEEGTNHYMINEPFSLPGEPMVAVLYGSDGENEIVRVDPCAITPTTTESYLETITDVEVLAGGTTTVTTTLHNNNVTATFTIDVTDNRDLVTNPNPSFTLTTSGERDLTFTITVPTSAERGELSKVVITASTSEYYVFTTFVITVIDEVVRCPTPSNPAGSSLHCDDPSLNIGTTCTISCGAEYRLDNEREMVCNADGTWSSDLPGDCIFVGSQQCQVWGDPHYTTFDGGQIDFMGECLYEVVKTLPGSSVEPISILAENVKNPGLTSVSFFKEGFVTIYNVTVTFKRGKIVFVDGVKVELPASLAGGKIQVKLVGTVVEMKTTSGLTVTYNGVHNFVIILAGSYMNSISGLCGNFNGDREDELTLGNMTFTNHADFGNTLEVVGGSAPGCRKGDPSDTDDQCTNPAERAKYQERCAALKGDCFSACSTDEDKESRFQSCVFDMCATAGRDKTLEEALDGLASECEEKGAEICDWREEFELPLACQANSEYHARANPCHNTCVDREAASRCLFKSKVAACVCKEGFVRSGLECVPLSKCGCTLGGRYFTNGQHYTTSDCSERCECGGGMITCAPLGCSEGNECRLLPTGLYSCEPERIDSCTASGDPHYTTLDGTAYDFMGKCAYVMVDTVELASDHPWNIKIIAQNENRGGSTAVSYVRSVTIKVPGYDVILGPDHAQISHDGMTMVTSDWTGGNGTYSIQVWGSSFVFRTTFGVKVTFGWSNLRIEVPSFFINKVRGMCGNYTGISHDEIGVGGADAFASQFIHDDSCEEDIGDFSCSDEDKTKWGGDDYCGKIHSDAFASCRDTVDATRFFDDCVFDLCATDGDMSALRNALSAYADECSSNEIPLCEWHDLTGLAPECPENERFYGCASFCENTCQHNAEAGCEIEGTIGRCVCDFGFIKSGDKCIPESECGCIVGEGGIYIEQRKTHMSENCTVLSRCVARGLILTTMNPCRDIATCRRRETGEYFCEPHERSQVTVYGDPVIKTFDDRYIRFHGTCAHLLVGFRAVDSLPEVPAFQVFGLNEAIEEGPYSRLARIMIEFWDSTESHSVTIAKERTVLFNDVEMKSATRVPTGVSVEIFPERIVINFEFGIQVQFNGEGWVRIEVEPKFEGHMHGMGGNYDGNADNDLLVEGDMMIIEENWGQYWIVDKYSERCDRDAPAPPHPCEASGLRERFSRDCDCGILKDTDGPFAACHAELDPTPFFEGCVYDMCATDGSSLSLLNIIVAYQSACINKDIRPGNWTDIVKISIPCGENSHHEECADPCQPTCGVDAGDCSGECSPGCVCDPGYMLESGVCVMEGRCGCQKFSGVRVPHGTCYHNDDCSTECTCINGTPECEESHCYDDQYCGTREGKFGCHFMDECEYENGGCSDTCNSVNGTVKCSCPLGSLLGEDGKKCIEIPSEFFDADTSECGSTFNVWKKEFLTWKHEIVPKWLEELEAYRAGGRNVSVVGECKYEWTEWLDRDDSGGCGDEETLERLIREYPDKVCKNPLAAEAQLADGRKIGAVIANFELSKNGLLCKNAEQAVGERCPDFAVRFLCPAS